MTIETKYNLGQEVWFTTFSNHTASAIISSIKITPTHTLYHFDNFAHRTEDKLFPSKIELLKSL